MSKAKDNAKDTTQSGSGAAGQGGTDQTQGQQSQGGQSSGDQQQNGQAPGDQNGQETAEAAAARIARENEAETARVAEENRKAEETRTKERERVAEEERVAKANRDRETAARTEAAKKDRERAEANKGGDVTGARAGRTHAPDGPKHDERYDDVRTNRTAREAQIAKANEAMERRADDSTEGAQALAASADDEEAIYAKLKDHPPVSGKAYDQNTPTAIAKDGTKVWGNPAAR